MAKNRNHYFKVKPGDDARLRRTAHDREPYGFLVDKQRRPYDSKRIADIVHLTNNRTGIVLAEAHAARLVETAAQFRSALMEAAGSGRKAKARLQRFEALCRELPNDVPLGSVYLMPSLVDDFLESEVGRIIGKLGGNPELVRFPATRLTTALTTQDKAQISESESESKPESESSSSVGERESSTARESGHQTERPMAMQAYTARCHEISVWQKRIPPMSEEAFAAAFEAEFTMSWDFWCSIRDAMENSIPLPCRDGHHVFEGGSQCVYCPFVRVGETA